MFRYANSVVPILDLFLSLSFHEFAEENWF